MKQFLEILDSGEICTRESEREVQNMLDDKVRKGLHELSLANYETFLDGRLNAESVSHYDSIIKLKKTACISITGHKGLNIKILGSLFVLISISTLIMTLFFLKSAIFDTYCFEEAIFCPHVVIKAHESGDSAVWAWTELIGIMTFTGVASIALSFWCFDGKPIIKKTFPKICVKSDLRRLYKKARLNHDHILKIANSRQKIKERAIKLKLASPQLFENEYLFQNLEIRRNNYIKKQQNCIFTIDYKRRKGSNTAFWESKLAAIQSELRILDNTISLNVGIAIPDWQSLNEKVALDENARLPDGRLYSKLLYDSD